MKKYSFVLILLTTALIWGCAHSPPNASGGKKVDGLTQLADWMTGAFSSQKQSQADEDYHDIRLHMVRIWSERKDGYWLYIEQAVADMPPYRQRVYHLTQLSSDLFQSAVFTFDHAESYAGEWEKEKPMASLTPEKLQLKAGCEIVMRMHGNVAFLGSSVGIDCESNLRGAKYATAEVEIRNDRILTWDRGFDSDGKHIWGAEKGGYVFNKLEDYPL